MSDQIEDAILGVLRKSTRAMNADDLVAAVAAGGVTAYRWEILSAVWCLADDDRIEFTGDRRLRMTTTDRRAE